MGKYLHKVEVTEQDHREAYDHKYNEPWVSYCTAADQNTPNVLYNKTYEELVNTPLTFYFPEGGILKLLTDWNASSAMTIEIKRGAASDWWTTYSGNGWAVGEGQWIQVRANNTLYYGQAHFEAEGDYMILGNIMSLIDSTNYSTLKTLPTDRVFQHLFHGSQELIDASGLVLPAETLTNYCYYEMFANCQKLENAPKRLPAKTLKEQCYYGMFHWCNALKRAPQIEATKLASYCCKEMFTSCGSLKYSPKLPAMDLADHCYENMFSSSGIVESPELPATRLATYCYHDMFTYCSSMKHANPIMATTLGNRCCYNMFYECISLEDAPDLLATNATEWCYLQMFRGCRSLVDPPKIYLQTTQDSCCKQMFRGCTNLRSIPILPNTVLAGMCYYEMFAYCPELKHAVVQGSTTSSGYCCDSMFNSCTKLEYIKLPDIQSTAYNSYSSMLAGCTSLKTIECFAEIPTNENALDNWTSNIPETGTFITKTGNSWQAGSNGIPSGWTVLKVE